VRLYISRCLLSFVHANMPSRYSTRNKSRYSTVVRGTNAYVPPGARKGAGQGAAAPPTTLPTVKEVEKTEVPKVSVNAPDGTEKTMPKSTSPPAGGAPAKVCHFYYCFSSGGSFLRVHLRLFFIAESYRYIGPCRCSSSFP